MDRTPDIFFRIALAGIAVVLASCDRNNHTTGWQYFDDMVKSPAYETYTANPNFPDGMTLQAPAEGTIPRGFAPYPYEKNDDDRIRAGLALVNSLEVTPASLKRGEQVYTVYCAGCHGISGDGKGHLYTTGKFPYPPANLLSDKMRAVPDGEIYHVITVGWGIMAEHGSIIRPEDRWKAVQYVRRVLQADN